MKILSSIPFSALNIWDCKRLKNKKHYTSKYNLLPFDQVLQDFDIEWVTIEDDKFYPILGVHAYGEGVYINRIAKGKTLTMRKYQKSQKDCLFWCKVRTVRGQFGVVYPNFEDSYGSSNMQYMKIRLEKINPTYLELLFQDNFLTQYMDTLSIGADGRHFNKSTLLKVKIPVPDSLEEQNRLVKKYEGTIAEAETCEKEVERLEKSIETYLFDSLGIVVSTDKSSTTNLLSFTSFNKLFKWGADFNLNSVNPKDVFKSTKYKNAPITSFCEINPITKYADNVEDISFVPMECVSDIYGEITSAKRGKTFLSKGYTRFQENDVIWAKITPCMQNGKSAVAKDLINGFAYGSTEYHVFRAFEGKALPEYIHAFMRTAYVRKVAQTYFTGSAGQQRVGTDFLEALTLPAIPIVSEDPNTLTQTMIVNHLSNIKEQIKSLRKKSETLRQLAKKEFEEAVFENPILTGEKL